MSTSASTFVTVVSSVVSLRYDDGKMLKGMGTLASKSRLTGVKGDWLLANLSKCRKQIERKQESLLLLLRGQKSVSEDEESWGEREKFGVELMLTNASDTLP